MTSTWHSLDTEADAVAVATVSAEAKTCALFERAIATLADGFTSAEIKDSDAARVRMGLLSQNLNSLKCSVDIAKRGYYTQSMGLVRGVYENWIAFHYLAAFPAAAEKWLAHDKRPPKHRVMLDALGPGFVEDKTDARGWYGTLCRFAHTDALVVLPHLGSCDGEACAFFGVTYKPDLFRTCAYTFSLFASIMLREVSQLILRDTDWLQSCDATVEALLQFINEENAAFTLAQSDDVPD
jgi:hypothetical protein